MGSKSLRKNSFFNVIYKFSNVLFPLIFTSYVSHVLLANGVGKVASAQNIVQYFTIIAALGIPNYGIREIAKTINNQNQQNIVFSELFIINFFSTLLCSIAYYGLIFSVSYFQNDRLLFAVVGLNIILNFINVDWFYQGKEEYGYITLRSVIVKTISLICIFIFVKNQNDYVVYGLISTLAIAGNYTFNIVHLKTFNIRLRFHNLSIQRHLKPVLLLLCTAIAIELYTLVDTTMLTYLTNSEVVAYYSNSMKLVKLLITMITAIGGVLLPRLSYHIKLNELDKCNEIVNSVFKSMLFLFVPSGIGLMLTADSIIPILFGQSFYPAVTTLRISALLVYALGFSNLFGTQVLLSFGGEKKLMLCTIVGALINISLNSLLIPKYLQNGAAIASIISEATVSILTYMFSKKYITLSISRKYIVNTICAALAMCICVISVKMIIHNSFVSLISSMSVGIVSYGFISIIGKNEVANSVIGLVRKKIK